MQAMHRRYSFCLGRSIQKKKKRKKNAGSANTPGKD